MAPILCPSYSHTLCAYLCSMFTKHRVYFSSFDSVTFFNLREVRGDDARGSWNETLWLTVLSCIYVILRRGIRPTKPAGPRGSVSGRWRRVILAKLPREVAPSWLTQKLMNTKQMLYPTENLRLKTTTETQLALITGHIRQWTRKQQPFMLHSGWNVQYKNITYIL